MKQNPITAPPGMLTVDAIRLMRENKLGCLPVVDKINWLERHRP